MDNYINDAQSFADWQNNVRILKEKLEKSESLLRVFADVSTDDDYPGGLWWTDYASGTRFEVRTGGIMNRRQLHRDDFKRAAEHFGITR